MEQSMLEVAHEMATDLYEIGAIDSVTMREFDALCLPKVKEMKPKDIKSLRLREEVSQAVFAKYLNISLSTVRQWEQGIRSPSGVALRLLGLVQKNGLESIAV